MRIKTLGLILCILMILSSGCGYLIVTGVGAVGGYTISRDTIEGVFEYSKESIYNSSREIIAIMGLIEEEDENAGIIIAKVQGAKVTITVTPFGDETTKFSVKARKNYFFPKLHVAQDIFVKVMSRM